MLINYPLNHQIVHPGRWFIHWISSQLTVENTEFHTHRLAGGCHLFQVRNNSQGTEDIPQPASIRILKNMFLGESGFSTDWFIRFVAGWFMFLVSVCAFFLRLESFHWLSSGFPAGGSRASPTPGCSPPRAMTSCCLNVGMGSLPLLDV